MHREHISFVTWLQKENYLLSVVLGFTLTRGIAPNHVQDIGGVKTTEVSLRKPTPRSHEDILTVII
jgi:hypothetical protein